MSADFESKSKEEHYKWAKKAAEDCLDRVPSEVELRNIGRIPWETSANWARQYTLRDPVILGLVEALNATR